MKTLAPDRQLVLFLGSMILIGAFIAQTGKLPAAQQVSVPEAIALVDAGAIVVDVRERGTSAGAHLPGALLVPLEVVVAHFNAQRIAKTQEIIVYCNQGAGRGPAAVKALRDAGYTNVVNLDTGIEGWRAARLPVARS